MTMQNRYPLYLANRPQYSEATLDVTDKYTGKVVSTVSLANTNMIDRAIEAAVEASDAMRQLPPYRRQRILNHCVRRFEERADALADSLCVEAGKPIKDSRGEVTRLIDTFRIAAEESVRIEGSVLNLEISRRAEGYRGMDRRVPIGPCSFISPFNFPLNLAAHKIAPAIAAGCPFVLKPASRTPIGALLIGEVLAETDLPRGAFSILPCHRDAADALTTDERFKLLSFTGSPEVGWDLKSKAGKKKVVLELGGNAACVVDQDADLDDAVERLIVGAFYQSGQSCIGVQRILVHHAVYDRFRDKLVDATRQLQMGDPKDESTFLGPVISESEGERLKGWIDEAIAAGATLLSGGGRDGAMVEATLLENVPETLPICAQEAFGPVAVLSTFQDFDQAIKQINDSRYGLQAGIFTRDLYKALKAWDELIVGGVVIGDIPSWRVDNMPYGGVKDSGLGREGIRYAIEEMTERRLLVIRNRV
ncbi:aldehyde dehydrogenase family protein [Roseiconus lacunae]|uniref:Aldehyde dehydrogenase family protein n=1 Tax=Roseiconus lacunae TaxID=2605694 RepID=A0ABT7PFZ0_9BACT|nr:aldehyde dehydrogenase family protein [Roseiconus lacunae]MDM4015414.1 aldehyde dehydrogenase family protein [Roseiconus lacunae]